MAAFRPSAHALKRAVAAFGQERVPILRLNMAAGDVQATWRKHATLNPAKFRYMAAFRPSAHALNHAVAGFGPERVVIPSLNMAAGDV
jgi:hypothetical protein